MINIVLSGQGIFSLGTPQEIGVYLTILTLPITIFYYTTTIRTQNKTRRAQLFMNIYSQYSTSSFWDKTFEMIKNSDLWEAEKLLNSNYLTIEPEMQAQFHAYASFFEGIGVLLNQNIIDLDLVASLMSSAIITSWETMRPIILRMREKNGEEMLYSSFEYLYNRVMEKNARGVIKK
jgi:hypothetical protein